MSFIKNYILLLVAELLIVLEKFTKFLSPNRHLSYLAWSQKSAVLKGMRLSHFNSFSNALLHGSSPQWENSTYTIHLMVNWYHKVESIRDFNPIFLLLRQSSGWGSRRQPCQKVAVVGKSAITRTTDECLRSLRVACKGVLSFDSAWNHFRENAITWSYCTKWRGSRAVFVYLCITLSSISADARKSEKHPGAQSTQPNTCSAAFWNQCAIAYSNFWYHTITPKVHSTLVQTTVERLRRLCFFSDWRIFSHIKNYFRQQG